MSGKGTEHGLRPDLIHGLLTVEQSQAHPTYRHGCTQGVRILRFTTGP